MWLVSVIHGLKSNATMKALLGHFLIQPTNVIVFIEMVFDGKRKFCSKYSQLLLIMMERELGFVIMISCKQYLYVMS